MEYHIYINDTIGWPISARYVRQELAKYKGKTCNVFINSFGGSVSDALEIRQMFLDHGDVTCYIHGMTASAATILAMGAKKIVMGKFALLLVHKVSNWVDTWGTMNADEIARAIEDLKKDMENLEKIDQVVANLYAARTGKTAEDMAALMKDGKWLNSQECKDLGIIDEITEEDQPSTVTDELKGRIMACGFPVPEISPQASENGLKKIFTDALKNFFGKKDKPELPEPATEDDQPHNEITNKIMKKKVFANLCTLLALAEIALDEEKGGTLTEEQLDAIEAKLASLESEKKAAEDAKAKLQTENDALTEQVNTLKKSDGEATDDVVETPADEDVNPVGAALKSYESIKNIL